MKAMTRREWEQAHGKQAHLRTFADLGWKWPPVKCEHDFPCTVDLLPKRRGCYCTFGV